MAALDRSPSRTLRSRSPHPYYRFGARIDAARARSRRSRYSPGSRTLRCTGLAHSHERPRRPPLRSGTRSGIRNRPSRSVRSHSREHRRRRGRARTPGRPDTCNPRRRASLRNGRSTRSAPRLGRTCSCRRARSGCRGRAGRRTARWSKTPRTRYRRCSRRPPRTVVPVLESTRRNRRRCSAACRARSLRNRFVRDRAAVRPGSDWHRGKRRRTCRRQPPTIQQCPMSHHQRPTNRLELRPRRSTRRDRSTPRCHRTLHPNRRSRHRLIPRSLMRRSCRYPWRPQRSRLRLRRPSWSTHKPSKRQRVCCSSRNKEISCTLT